MDNILSHCPWSPPQYVSKDDLQSPTMYTCQSPFTNSILLILPRHTGQVCASFSPEHIHIDQEQCDHLPPFPTLLIHSFVRTYLPIGPIPTRSSTNPPTTNALTPAGLAWPADPYLQVACWQRCTRQRYPSSNLRKSWGSTPSKSRILFLVLVP